MKKEKLLLIKEEYKKYREGSIEWNQSLYENLKETEDFLKYIFNDTGVVIGEITSQPIIELAICFSDEDNLKKIMSKLKLKVFW